MKRILTSPGGGKDVNNRSVGILDVVIEEFLHL